MVPQTKWEKKRIKRLSKIINMKSRHFVSAAVDSVDSTGSKGDRVVEVRHQESREHRLPINSNGWPITRKVKWRCMKMNGNVQANNASVNFPNKINKL